MTSVIPVGGIQVTNDISVVKGISLETAERIKLEAGCCWMDLIEDHEEVILPGVGGRPPVVIPRSEICEIVQPRMEEIFRIIKSKIDPILKSRPLSGYFTLPEVKILLPVLFLHFVLEKIARSSAFV